MLRRINLATIDYSELQALAAKENQPPMKELNDEERLTLAEKLMSVVGGRNKYFYDEDELKAKIDTTGKAGSNDDEEDGDDEYDYNDGFLVKDEDYKSEEDDADYVPSKESEDEAELTSSSDDEDVSVENPAKRKRPRTSDDNNNGKKNPDNQTSSSSAKKQKKE